MKYFLPFLLVLFSCQSNENQVEDKPEKEPIELSQRPPIEDIQELYDLLIQADRITTYNFNPQAENPANMSENDMTLYDPSNFNVHPTAYNGKDLPDNSRDELVHMLCDTSIYNGELNGTKGTCFIPHVGFGFFVKDSLIAQTNVCFLCSGVQTSPRYKSDGFSENGYAWMRAFLERHDMVIVDH
ncbi:hypothetical protein [Sanyastnella coralliicola]|uniref:hypothetical protein n=1 Tax=Sanyastnella coralliicola TaxID=3069118 RepID=UPI0027B8FD98|nr:hypothetical protein [Longitalea sp. SCSIO 12813]